MNAGSSDPKTRPLSLRLSDGEHARIREVARRLGTSEAAVIRFAIRHVLKELAPLHDPHASGLSLLPVFVERGADLAASFDLDVSRLDQIINQNVQDTRERVERDDLALLSMAGLSDPRLHAKLRQIQSGSVEPGNAATLIRAYFYSKYIYGDSRKGAAGAETSVAPQSRPPDFQDGEDLPVP